MSGKMIFSVGVIFALIIFIIFFKGTPELLSTLIIIAALVKHKMYPIKKELFWFLTVCFGGTVVEILLINFASAWSYSNADLLGLPVWMPLFWGAVGTSTISLYESFVRQR